MTRFYLIAFLVSGVANFVFSILILRYLSASNIKVSYFEIRWQIHKHLKTYKKITKERSGKVGLPYYGYLTTLCLLIVSAILCLTST